MTNEGLHPLVPLVEQFQDAAFDYERATSDIGDDGWAASAFATLHSARDALVAELTRLTRENAELKEKLETYEKAERERVAVARMVEDARQGRL